MTDNFKDILFNQHPKSLMSGIYWLVLVICIIAPIVTGKFWLSLLINACILLVTALINEYIFFEWWQKLNEAVQNNQDHLWIAGHDGGIIIVSTGIRMKCLGIWLVSVIFAFIVASLKEEVEV